MENSPEELNDTRGLDLYHVVAIVLGMLLVATPHVTEAQQAGRVLRIGILSDFPVGSPRLLALQEGLSALGYVEGKSVAIEWRSALVL